MKRLSFVLILSIFFTGCSLLRLPSSKNDSAQKKVTQIEAAIDKAQEQKYQAATAYIYGARYSLSLDPNLSQYGRLAYDLTDKSLLITGGPSVKEANQFKEIVDKLTSTNTVDNVKGKDLLAEKDSQISVLQTKSSELESKLDKAETKLRQVATENSSLADIVVKVKRWFYFILYGIIAVFIIRIIAIFCPPPWNFALKLPELFFGGLFKIGAKLMPDVKQAAGMVSKDVHQLSESTLTSLIHAIEEAKEESGAVAESLSPVLKDKTNLETRAKINEIKLKLKNSQVI